MPRRYADYLPTDGFTGLNTFSTIGSFILGISTLPFLYNVWRSYKTGPVVEVDDPWVTATRWSGPPRVRRRRHPVRHRPHRRPATSTRGAVAVGLRRRRPLRADPNGREPPGAGDHKGSIFLSPHKFVGGPQTSGVLVVLWQLVRNRVPTAAGGGTRRVRRPDRAPLPRRPRRPGGGRHPAIVESIRAGLVFALKQAVGIDLIQAREEQLWRHALHRWRANPRLEILGNPGWTASTSSPRPTRTSAEDFALGFKNLLEAERGFRDLKSTLLLRPVFHRLEHRIRAHVLICWLALLLTRVAERAGGLSWRHINRQRRPVRLAMPHRRARGQRE
jgi:hypothetical protein